MDRNETYFGKGKANCFRILNKVSEADLPIEIFDVFEHDDCDNNSMEYN